MHHELARAAFIRDHYRLATRPRLQHRHPERLVPRGHAHNLWRLENILERFTPESPEKPHRMAHALKNREKKKKEKIEEEK